MAQPYRKNAVYGSLAYDLDALVRERQLEEAGKLPSKQQPSVQEKPLSRRRPQARAAARPSPLVVGGVVVLLAMVVVLMLGYVTLTDVSGSVSSIKRQISDLDEQHVALLTEYEKTFDLATIKAAAEAAGMSNPPAARSSTSTCPAATASPSTRRRAAPAACWIRRRTAGPMCWNISADSGHIMRQ